MKELRVLLALIVLVGAACGGDTNQPTASAAKTADAVVGDVIEIRGLDTLKFDPDTVTVDPGTYTIAFENAGAIIHQLALSEKGGHGAHELGDTGNVSGGKTKNIEVNLEPGTYEYACHYLTHYESGMKGTLTVNASR